MVAEARWALSSGTQRTDREADHSPASNAEFKNKGTVHYFPLNALVAWTEKNLSFCWTSVKQFWAQCPKKFWVPYVRVAGPSGRAVQVVGLRPPASWYCGFEFRRGHGCLSVVSVVCCQVEVSATGWSLVRRSPTDCGASLCVIYKLREWGDPGPLGAVAPKTNYLRAVQNW